MNFYRDRIGLAPGRHFDASRDSMRLDPGQPNIQKLLLTLFQMDRPGVRVIAVHPGCLGDAEQTNQFPNLQRVIARLDVIDFESPVGGHSHLRLRRQEQRSHNRLAGIFVHQFSCNSGQRMKVDIELHEAARVQARGRLQGHVSRCGHTDVHLACGDRSRKRVRSIVAGFHILNLRERDGPVR